MSFFFYLLVSYIIGAIPSSYLVCRFLYGYDITKKGSTNAGATNAARTSGNPIIFFIVFFLDAGKAFLALFLLSRFFVTHTIPFSPQMGLYFCAAALLIGNSFSLFLKGKGGKGVATLYGITAFLAPLIFPILLISWGGAFSYTRISSRASLISMSLLIIISILTLLYGRTLHPGIFFFLVLAALFVIARHKKNIHEILGA